MDIQEVIDNKILAERNNRMKTSKQLTLEELIAKLEPLLDNQKEIEKKYKHKANVEFDFSNTFPVGLSSWRGSYDELALEWEGGDYSTDYDKQMNVTEFVEMLKSAIGKTYTGWKGGEFEMGKTTPIWVANSGLSGKTAVVDVRDEEYYVVLITSECEF